jgi:hypothetical protein
VSGQHHPDSSRFDGVKKDRDAFTRRQVTLEDRAPAAKYPARHFYGLVGFEALRWESAKGGPIF